MFFCVETGRLVGFVVSRDWIRIYPLTIAVVVALPPPSDIIELQSLQGKEIFLHHFVCNFVEKMHGYMCLLKKNTPFLWDHQAQRDFDHLKKGNTLNCVSPRTLFKRFILYIVASITTIGMVLVQEDTNE